MRKGKSARIVKMAEDDGRALRVTLDLIQGAEKGGFLYATIGSREVAPVMVSAKEVRLLLAMDEAMRRDRTKPEEARGWRDAEQIGRLVEELPAPSAWPLAVGTVRRYICNLRKLWAVAGQLAALDVPELIRMKRGFGYRLAVGLTVIDRSQPEGNRPEHGRQH